MGKRSRLTFLGWTLPKKTTSKKEKEEIYVNRTLGDAHEAMQHEGDKLKAYLKVKKLVPRYNRS
jgi:hypothetical protein